VRAIRVQIGNFGLYYGSERFEFPVFGSMWGIIHAITRSHSRPCPIYRPDRDQVIWGIDECSPLLYCRDRLLRFGTLYIALRAAIPALKRSTLKPTFRERRLSGLGDERRGVIAFRAHDPERSRPFPLIGQLPVPSKGESVRWRSELLTFWFGNQ
jgi:hypothetical protein